MKSGPRRRRNESAPARGGANPHYEKIWAVVRAIPAGCVTSYGDVAARAGLTRRARLVGRALSVCPNDLPWHRVINAQGRIAFPAGSAQYRRQRRRLEAEGVIVRRGRVDLERYGWRDSLDALLWRPDSWTQTEE